MLIIVLSQLPSKGFVVPVSQTQELRHSPGSLGTEVVGLRAADAARGRETGRGPGL